MHRTRIAAALGLVVVAFVVLAAVLATGPRGDEELAVAVDELRTDLDQRDERIVALEEELAEIRDEVSGLSLTQQRDTSAGRLDDLEESVAGIVGAVAEFDEAIDGVDEALAAVDEELSAGARERAEIADASGSGDAALSGELAGLSGELAGLRSTVDQARGQIEDLEVRYDTLRERVDRISAR